MTNEQKIKEACIKANPEIMELKFGCKLISNIGNYALVCSPTGSGNALVMEIKDTHYLRTEWFADSFEILGREIHLADVLLAIQELEPEQRPMYFNVGCDGGFYEVKYTYPDGNKCVIEHHGLRMGAGWNLRKDSLSDQTEQTKQFLADLLDKKY